MNEDSKINNELHFKNWLSTDKDLKLYKSKLKDLQSHIKQFTAQTEQLEALALALNDILIVLHKDKEQFLYGATDEAILQYEKWKKDSK